MNQPFDYKTTPEPQNPQQNVYNRYYPYDFTPETHIEKKGLKKVANIIGLSGLIMLAAPIAIRYGLRFFVEFLRLLEIDYSFIYGAAFSQILQIFFSISVFLLPFVILFKLASFRISDLISFQVPQKKDILPYFLIGISFCSLANIAVSYLGNFLRIFGVEYEVNYGENPEGIFGFMLTFIATAIVPALVEEFACRGVMLGALKKYGNGFAVVVSAIVFGVLHGNFQQMPFAFLVGLVLGFVTLKTGSIWLAIFIHAFNNAVSVILDYAFSAQQQMAQNIAYSLFLIVTLLLGLIAVFMLTKRQNAYAFEKTDVKSKIGKRYLWFFTAPAIIAFVCINVIESFAYFKI